MAVPAPPRLLESTVRFSSFASLIAALIGAFVVVRWALALPHPLGAVWAWGVMSPLSGLVACLSGLALWLLIRPTPTRRAWGTALAALALALCIVRGLGFWNGTFDAWLIHWRLAPVFRMAPNSLVGFGLIDLALLVLDRRWPGEQHPAQWLSLAALFVGYVDFLGYALHLTGLTGFAGWPAMAIASAIALGLLALGTLAARPQRGWVAVVTGETPGGALLRRLLPPLMLAVPVLGFLRMLGQRLGLLSPSAGATWMAGVLVVIAVGLLWRNAIAVDRIAAERRRAALLHQAELQKRELEVYARMDAMKDQFFDIVSHELRTPINALTGFGSILEDELAGPLNAEQRRYLGQMLTSADKLLHLINNLLDLSRMRAGKLTLVPRAVSIDEVLCGVSAQFEPLFEQKRQQLTLELPEALPVLCADDQRLAQVLSNLLDNAAKFSPPESTIVLSARLERDQLLCEITDGGDGIPPEDLERIFAPFTQRDMSRTRTVGGSGLGLAIAKAIVTAHGGIIGVRSTPGRGSTFWFTLPLTPPAGSEFSCEIVPHAQERPSAQP